MTPAEFTGWVQAYRTREERQWERVAWTISHHYAMHMKKGKKPPTIDKLLGRKPKRLNGDRR